jgi:ketosteroid isomerase-like protein
MKTSIYIALGMFLSTSVMADDSNFDPEKFANEYFSAWTASQAPNATTDNLEDYLALLKDDVGHQHIPYDPDDTRTPDGKQQMRVGMSHYLGKHIEYKSEFIGFTYGLNALALQFHVSLEAKRGPDSPIETMSYNAMEVLEIEDGKVAMIRKYQ